MKGEMTFEALLANCHRLVKDLFLDEKLPPPP